MIMTTEFHGNKLLIDPFAIDAVIYMERQKSVELVLSSGKTYAMKLEVFEADLLPLVLEINPMNQTTN